MYESPVDLTLCAASKWIDEGRAKTPHKSETPESQVSESNDVLPSTNFLSEDCPRPRTVVISHHHHRGNCQYVFCNVFVNVEIQCI